MNINKFFIFSQFLLFSYCLCDISDGLKEKLLVGFIDYYNNLPDQVYNCDDGYLQSVIQVDDSTYKIAASLKVTVIPNYNEEPKTIQCTATVKESNRNVIVTNHQCQEPGRQNFDIPAEVNHEVPSDITIQRPRAPCMGCSSHVNSQADGVSELANLGVRHLDFHDPSVKHSLDSVINVERQVVNGVRYILTLSITFNACIEEQTEKCVSSKICKITVLEKPWIKLASGGKYRAILANNCTDQWLYGDDGEVLPELTNDNPVEITTSIKNNDTNDEKPNTNVPSESDQEKILTDEDLKNLLDQIIFNSNKQFEENTETYQPVDKSDVNKKHAVIVESDKNGVNSNPVTESVNTDQDFDINLDKKKAIDNLLDLFNFYGFQFKINTEDEDDDDDDEWENTDYDLQVVPFVKYGENHENDIDEENFIDEYELEKGFYRTKRQPHSRVRRAMVGGAKEDDPTKPEYKALADESLKKYVQDSGITDTPEVVKINKASKQLVAGILYRIEFQIFDSQNYFVCESTIYDVPWRHEREITVTCKAEERDFYVPDGDTE